MAVHDDSSWSSVRLDATSVKVLAHPLRSRLLTALRGGGPATATALAGRLGTNSGATSYHLRRLAEVGLVEDAGPGQGRERWWRASTDMHSWDDVDTEGDPDARTAGGWLRQHYLRLFVEHAETWLEHHDGWPLAWRRLAGHSDYRLSMTPAQLESLMTDLWAVVDRHHAAAAEANAALPDDLPPEDRPQTLMLYLHDFPLGEYPDPEQPS